MSDRFPNLGAIPSRQGHAPSLSAGAASAQAGMVRIQRGSELRYIWPVHLPGWLASGWQVGSGETRAESTPAAPVVVTPDVLSYQPPAVSAASAPDTALATTTSGSRDASTPSAGQAIATIADPDSPRQPEADLTAHLPTNLLGLDQEPAGEQATPAENDAVSAWNPAPEAVDQPVDSVGSVDSLSRELPAAPAGAAKDPELAAEADGPHSDATEPVEPVTELAVEPTPPPASARRGRPRKVRQDVQPENQAEPAAEGAAQEQPAATLLSTAGDDPFGIDPLL
ncbi:MAG: hypothetical protein WCI65_11000 [Synechococcaceae cyanobacterium ELA263]